MICYNYIQCAHKAMLRRPPIKLYNKTPKTFSKVGMSATSSIHMRGNDRECFKQSLTVGVNEHRQQLCQSPWISLLPKNRLWHQNFDSVIMSVPVLLSNWDAVDEEDTGLPQSKAQFLQRNLRCWLRVLTSSSPQASRDLLPSSSSFPRNSTLSITVNN